MDASREVNNTFDSCTHCGEPHIAGRCCGGHCNFCGDDSDTERCPQCELLTDDCDCTIRRNAPSTADHEAFLPTICCILNHCRNVDDVTPAQMEALVQFTMSGLNCDDAHLRVLCDVKFTVQEWVDARTRFPAECEY